MPDKTPLADRVRPTDFDEIAGQRHLFGEQGILRRMVDRGVIPSMIFFGPPGCGKTTAASIIAERAGKTLFKLNATTASLSDVRDVAKETGTLLGSGGVLLYLDEIQYFNKKQQQSLLEYLEDGRITLIASTTENPYYYIYDALLSRCSVFEFKHVDAADIEERLRAVAARAYPGAEIADGAFRLRWFNAGRLVTQLLLLVSIAVHVIANVKPALIAFGIRRLKPRAADALFVLSALLLVFAAAFIVYYVCWNAAG